MLLRWIVYSTFHIARSKRSRKQKMCRTQKSRKEHRIKWAARLSSVWSNLDYLFLTSSVTVAKAAVSMFPFNSTASFNNLPCSSVSSVQVARAKSSCVLISLFVSSASKPYLDLVSKNRDKRSPDGLNRSVFLFLLSEHLWETQKQGSPWCSELKLRNIFFHHFDLQGWVVVTSLVTFSWSWSRSK